MKKYLLVYCFFFFYVFSAIAQQTYVPDDNFEQFLINIGRDDVLDNYVLTSNIANITSLNMPFKSIHDLTGIEDFTDLTNLNCSYNILSSLDVSKNSALIKLQCSNNILNSLDVNPNSALTELYCSSNLLTNLNVSGNNTLTKLYCHYNMNLSNLDVSACTALTTLYCHSNSLNSLDVSANSVLTELHCYSNNLSSLDVSANSVLTELHCHSNNLSSLDVSANSALTELHCYSNNLSSLDVSANSALTELVCDYNSLSNLDTSTNTLLKILSCAFNNLSSLNVKNGNNTNFSFFNVTNNVNLSCIQVDNISYSNTNWSTKKDVTASFSEDCYSLEIKKFNQDYFTFYPNPVKDELNIKLNQGLELKQINIYNIQSQYLYSTKALKIDTKNLKSGMYFLEVETNQGKSVKKIVVQ